MMGGAARTQLVRDVVVVIVVVVVVGCFQPFAANACRICFFSLGNVNILLVLYQ